MSVLLQVEPIRNFFAALFLASIGMLIHMHFLWNHVDILLAAVLLVIVIKTVVVAIVVKVFGYNNKTAVLVRSDPFSFPVFKLIPNPRREKFHNFLAYRLECPLHRLGNLLLYC